MADPTGAERDHPPAQVETGTDSDLDSTSHSGRDSEGATTAASGHEGRSSARCQHLATSQVQKLLEQSDKDVIVIDEQVGTDGLETVHLKTSWGHVSSKPKWTGLPASLPGSHSSNLGWKRSMMVGIREMIVSILQGSHLQPEGPSCWLLMGLWP